MFKKILLAYDGSASGIAALHRSAELAKLCDAQLHLLGIIATSGFNALAEGFGADIWGMERKSLDSALGAAVKGLTDRGVNAVASIVEGDPAGAIVDQAHALGCDLVVLGHSSRGLIGRWFEGSVGHAVLDHLPCNMLIVSCEEQR